MKYLLHRTAALLLAVLLLCSAAAVPAAALNGLPEPGCVLGTTAADMLAGGGRQVRTDRGVYVLRDEDGAICLQNKMKTAVVEGPASRLNYADGTLYFAREGEESFNLCAYDLKAEEERVLLKGFAGELGQMYEVDGVSLYFSSGNAVWQLELESGDYRLVLYADGLRSFVPTGCGLLYAVGELFDYTLLANGQVVAEHVDSYYTELDENGGLLVYAQAGEDLQQDLAAAFGGVVAPAAFAGCDYVSLAAETGDELSEAEFQADFEREAERLEAEHEEMMRLPGSRLDTEPAPPDPADADPNDPQLPPDLIPTEPEPTEPEPVEPEPTEPAPVEPEPTEPAPVEPEPTEPAPTEPEPTEPAPTEPEPTEPEPTESEPAEPAPVEPEPTEPEPTKPAPVEPEPTKPEPTEPAPTEPQPTEPAPAEPQPSAPTVTGNGTASQPLEDPVFVVEPQVYPATVFPDGLRASVTTGQQNIVRRARQLLNIQWTPKRTVGGYGYTDSSYNNYGKIKYVAGTTYKGIPYGQGMVYVPWSASLTDFVNAVNNPNSKFYTARNSTGRGSQYYGTDCSGFVSWCWNLNRRTLNNNSGGMASSSISTRIGTDYTKVQIGDALIRENNSWSHSRLVTDVTYKSDGVTIESVEVSEANPTTAHSGCCYSTRYSGSGLNSICSSSYAIYRSRTRNNASYTHECVVPLEGDYCTICGAGSSFVPHPEESYLTPGIDVSYAQGTVSWQTVAPQISFAILRIGYTGSQAPVVGKDSYFDANVAGCIAQKVPYGIYWYAGATTVEQAVEEASTVIEYLSPVIASGSMPSLPIFYDVEQTNNILSLDDASLQAVITAFCSTIEECGFKAGVYASTNIWNTRLTGSAYSHWARWVAQWGTDVMTASKGANVWQYTNTGNLAGISTKVDMNYWMGTPGDTEHPSTAVVTQPTCTGEGMMTNVCLLCGETRQIPITPLGHVFSGGYCVRCGQLQGSASRFYDVPEDKWFTIPVYWAVAQGITVGTSATTFSPYEECGRAQILTFLWRAAGSPEPAGTQNPFTDVSEENYYYKPVLWAYSQEPKLTTGVTETLFGPNESCTRAQAVYYLWRAAGSPEPEPEQMPFTDVPELAYYWKAVLWAKQNAITAGTGETTFGSNETCTRAQIVTFLYLAENLSGESEEPQGSNR